MLQPTEHYGCSLRSLLLRAPQLNMGVSRTTDAVKYKNLKSVAHNFGHSFTSDMNWAGSDHVMTLLARAAIATGLTELDVDIRGGTAAPAGLIAPALQDTIAHQPAKLDHLLTTQRADPARVPGARMRLRLDVARRSAHPSEPHITEFPFDCVVELTDDRGAVHRGEVRAWWRMEADPL